MDGLTANISLRPRSMDEVFDLAAAYLRVHFRDLAGAVAKLYGLPFLCLAALAITTDISVNGLWAAALIVTGFANETLTVFAGAHMFRRDPSVKQSVKIALSTPGPTLAHALFAPAPWIFAFLAAASDDQAAQQWTAIGLALSIFWVPAAAAAQFIPHVLYLEQPASGAVIRRAIQLLDTRIARATGCIVLCFVIHAAGALVVETVITAVLDPIFQLGEAFAEVIAQHTWIALGLTGPWVTLARLFEYADARTTREGWDVQVQFNRIAVESKQRLRA